MKYHSLLIPSLTCIATAAFAAEELPNLETQSTRATILEGGQPRIKAVPDFERHACPFNSDGGLVTKIVNAAYERGVGEGVHILEFSRGAERHSKALEGPDENVISFPWYRPNCETPSFLDDHTRRLCAEFEWSAPLYETTAAYYARTDNDRKVRFHHDVFGSTVCVAGKEFPTMLRDNGVTDLTTRIIRSASPSVCLTALAAGNVDFAFLPDEIAIPAIEEVESLSTIERREDVTSVISLHAIAPKASPNAVMKLDALDRGLASMRADGSWFSIVAEFANGHDHDHAYSHESQHSHSVSVKN